MFERIGGGIRGAKDFDLETLEELARRKIGRGKLFGNEIKQSVRVGGAGLFIYAKDRGKFIRQPDTAGRAAKEMEVFAEESPDLR